MGINKVQYGNRTLIDLTNDTVATNTLLEGITAHDRSGALITGTLPTPSFQTKTKTYTPTTSQQTDTILPDTGYDGLSEVDVTVNAMPTMTLPQFMSNTSSGTFINGLQGTTTVKYLNIPIGYNATAQYYQISAAAGSAGTPTATKGTVSNHSITVTPSVTNTTGYITGSTKTGTPVTVSASELDSGTKSITENGTGIDVVGYAAVDVSVSGGVDMPTFTVDSTMTSVTCDKTFAECVEYASNDVSTALVSTPYGISAAFNVAGSATQLTYVVSDPVPEVDIVYNSDGTINLVMPSTYRETLSVTQNGTYYPSRQNKAITEVTVNVSGAAINNQNKTVTSSGTLQTVTYDNGYTGLGTVTINAAPSATIGVADDYEFTTVSGVRKWNDILTPVANETGWITEGWKTPFTIPYNAVPANTVITPTESTQTVGGSLYMMEGAVTIDAIDSEYVGSLVPRVTSTDITASGPTVTMPSGFYSAELTKTVASGSASGPSSLSGTSATVSTGTNTLTLTKTGVATTPTVSAGYVSSATASTATVTLTANVTTQGATTYHPSTTNQTIASGRYLTGTQTINAVTTSNLSASNIVSGVTIKVGDSSDDDCVASVTGNVVLQNYYTGSSAPSSSTGSNGDLYLQS